METNYNVKFKTIDELIEHDGMSKKEAIEEILYLIEQDLKIKYDEYEKGPNMDSIG